MYLGVDLGTSSLKTVLVDPAGAMLAEASAPLTVQHPAFGWSEQDPADWWRALLATFDALRRARPRAWAEVAAIGLSGQMHGAVLLGGDGAVLRPCILWNDTRATAECATLEVELPELRAIAGNIAMPGFTAPKLRWVRTHEPAIFAVTAHVLLPKAWLRYKLTGERIEEMSDASGTLWLDVGARRWSKRLLAACGLDERAMPRLVEGCAPSGALRPALARELGFARPPMVAGGAGDNAAGAVGLGAIRPGDAFLSLGTSGVVFVTTGRFVPWPEQAVHAFCHALPGTWHQMSVTLSAAASLAWWGGVTGLSEDALIAELPAKPARPSPIFLPYLCGERTPHNDGAVRGAFLDLDSAANRETLTRAVLEGVAFSLRDGLDAILASGTAIEELDVIGGGAGSGRWLGILADILGRPVHQVAAGPFSVALGAARLARLSVTDAPMETVCRRPARLASFVPDPARAARYATSLARYRQVSQAIRDVSAPGRVLAR